MDVLLSCRKQTMVRTMTGRRRQAGRRLQDRCLVSKAFLGSNLLLISAATVIAAFMTFANLETCFVNGEGGSRCAAGIHNVAEDRGLRVQGRCRGLLACYWKRHLDTVMVRRQKQRERRGSRSLGRGLGQAGDALHMKSRRKEGQ